MRQWFHEFDYTTLSYVNDDRKPALPFLICHLNVYRPEWNSVIDQMIQLSLGSCLVQFVIKALDYKSQASWSLVFCLHDFTCGYDPSQNRINFWLWLFDIAYESFWMENNELICKMDFYITHFWVDSGPTTLDSQVSGYCYADN